jgi:hypothetical protein
LSLAEFFSSAPFREIREQPPRIDNLCGKLTANDFLPAEDEVLYIYNYIAH